jgi:hypothetical protein
MSFFRTFDPVTITLEEKISPEKALTVTSSSSGVFLAIIKINNKTAIFYERGMSLCYKKII